MSGDARGTQQGGGTSAAASANGGPPASTVNGAGSARSNGHGDRVELSSDLLCRLRALERVVPPDEIDEVWIFPPLEEPEGSREFVLFTRLGHNGDRYVYSARAPLADGNGGIGAGGEAPGAERMLHGDDGTDATQTVVEHGRVPAGRLPRFVDRFQRRLGDDRAPVYLRLEGAPDRWVDLVGAAD